MTIIPAANDVVHCRLRDITWQDWDTVNTLISCNHSVDILRLKAKRCSIVPLNIGTQQQHDDANKYAYGHGAVG